MTKPPTQYEEIKEIWLNALNSFRPEELLLHFPAGKFGWTLGCDMTPVDAVITRSEERRVGKECRL